MITQRYEVTKEEQNPEIFKSELVIGLEVGVVGQGIFTFYYRIISTFFGLPNEYVSLVKKKNNS